MFHWICPECGREIAPTVRECSVCDPAADHGELVHAGVVEAPARTLSTDPVTPAGTPPPAAIEAEPQARPSFVPARPEAPLAPRFVAAPPATQTSTKTIAKSIPRPLATRGDAAPWAKARPANGHQAPPEASESLAAFDAVPSAAPSVTSGDAPSAPPAAESEVEAAAKTSAERPVESKVAEPTPAVPLTGRLTAAPWARALFLRKPIPATPPQVEPRKHPESDAPAAPESHAAAHIAPVQNASAEGPAIAEVPAMQLGAKLGAPQGTGPLTPETSSAAPLPPAEPEPILPSLDPREAMASVALRSLDSLVAAMELLPEEPADERDEAKAAASTETLVKEISAATEEQTADVSSSASADVEQSAAANTTTAAPDVAKPSDSEASATETAPREAAPKELTAAAAEPVEASAEKDGPEILLEKAADKATPEAREEVLEAKARDVATEAAADSLPEAPATASAHPEAAPVPETEPLEVPPAEAATESSASQKTISQEAASSLEATAPSESTAPSEVTAQEAAPAAEPESKPAAQQISEPSDPPVHGKIALKVLPAAPALNTLVLAIRQSLDSPHRKPVASSAATDRQAAAMPEVQHRVKVPAPEARIVSAPTLTEAAAELPHTAQPVKEPETPKPFAAPPMAPLGNYSPLAGHPLQPAVPRPTVLKADGKPRITLPGPMLTPRLVKFGDKGLTATFPEARRFRKRAMPAWLLASLVGAAVVAVGFSGFFSIVPRSNADTRTETSAPVVVGHNTGSNPLSKMVEVTGFRVLVDPAKKSEIQYLVVNHSSSRFADATVYVTLRSIDAKVGQAPLCRFSFTAPDLGPYESREMSSMIEKLNRPITVPGWQDLRADVEIGQ